MVRIFLKALAFGTLCAADTTTVSDVCSANSSAIPYDAIGSNLRSALNAAEGGEDGPSAIVQIMRGFSDVRDGRSALSFQIARNNVLQP